MNWRKGNRGERVDAAAPEELTIMGGPLRGGDKTSLEAYLRQRHLIGTDGDDISGQMAVSVRRFRELHQDGTSLIRIAEVTHDDPMLSERYARLARRCLNASHVLTPDMPVPVPTRFYVGLAHVEGNEEVVATMSLTDYMDKGEVALLDNVASDVRVRRKGAARALFAGVIALPEYDSVEVIHAAITPENARGFYEKIGFVAVGDQPYAP